MRDDRAVEANEAAIKNVQKLLHLVDTELGEVGSLLVLSVVVFAA